MLLGMMSIPTVADSYAKPPFFDEWTDYASTPNFGVCGRCE